MPEALDEPILSDDYPIYAGYWYVVDGRPFRSAVNTTVGRLLKQGSEEVRRCDAVARKLPLL